MRYKVRLLFLLLLLSAPIVQAQDRVEWTYTDKDNNSYTEHVLRNYTHNDNEAIQVSELNTSRPFPSLTYNKKGTTNDFSFELDIVTFDRNGTMTVSQRGGIPLFHNRTTEFNFSLSITVAGATYETNYQFEETPDWNFNGDLTQIIDDKRDYDWDTEYLFYPDNFSLGVEHKYTLSHITGDNYTLRLRDILIKYSPSSPDYYITVQDEISKFGYSFADGSYTVLINGTDYDVPFGTGIDPTDLAPLFSYDFTLPDGDNVPTNIRQTEVVRSNEGFGLSGRLETRVQEYTLKQGSQIVRGQPTIGGTSGATVQPNEGALNYPIFGLLVIAIVPIIVRIRKNHS